MKVVLHRRAEIQLRFLDAHEHARISDALERLKHTSAGKLPRLSEMRSMGSGADRELFVYDIGNAMRLVFSIGDDAITVEDIAPKERFENVA